MPSLTDEQCKKIIKEIAMRACIRPHLITERLLSEEDKEDMRNGDLGAIEIKSHLRAWIKEGLPDYAHGKTDKLKKNERQIEKIIPEESGGLVYRKPF